MRMAELTHMCANQNFIVSYNTTALKGEFPVESASLSRVGERFSTSEAGNVRIHICCRAINPNIDSKGKEHNGKLQNVAVTEQDGKVTIEPL
ncbi:hypothetical protein AVEN_130715-1 [Araneus ventricosus]|uniref:Uncharacterized protein n=1 Tax=Araneus ventricosus TaxID=182803 RepID=A0A4Y2F805_ARAVE|nr:hypothetical protein AVEN_130715-1 [Araneus ventricosus]